MSKNTLRLKSKASVPVKTKTTESIFGDKRRNPCKGQCKLALLFQGQYRAFPGNASLMEYFRTAITENYINEDNTALFQDEKEITFKELDLYSTRASKYIRNMLASNEFLNNNPDHDFVIGVCVPPSIMLIEIIFAILKLGAAYVPFDPTFPEDRVVKMTQDCRPVLIIADSHGPIMSKFDPILGLTNVLSVQKLKDEVKKDVVTEADDFEPFPGIESLADRIAVILYTSGSSGEPKGLKLNHRTILNRLYWQWKTFQFHPDEQCCLKTQITFIDSVAEIFAPLLQGFHLTIFNKHVISTPHLLLQRIFDDGITRITVVPSLLRAILHIVISWDQENTEAKDGKALIEKCKLWICSGDLFPRDLLEDFFLHCGDNSVICNFYGCTELMGDVTYEVFKNLDDVREKVDSICVPIGNAIFNTVVYVLNDRMKVCTEGEVGEIYVAGYSVSNGYVGNKNGNKYLDNPFTSSIGFERMFRTGDFARIMRREGKKYLYYEGRVDTQVKVRGYRVDLLEIEDAIIHRNDLVLDAVVLCYHRGEPDQTLVAFAVAKNHELHARIDMMMKTKLRSYELPELKLLDKLPLMINGKVDRQRLLLAYEDERNNRDFTFEDWNVTADQMRATTALVQTISDITGTAMNNIVHDLEDSFFNLGGTSLNAIEVVMALRARHYSISIGEFISSKTIKDIISKLTITILGSQLHIGLNQAFYNYFTEPITPELQEQAIDILASAFVHKNDLCTYAHVTHQDFLVSLSSMFKFVVVKGYSFVVRRKSDNKMIGVAINFDANDEPTQFSFSKEFQLVNELILHVENAEREQFPSGKRKVFHSYLIGTHEDIDPNENVSLVTYMEQENINLARKKKFTIIISTNTSPLTTQICENVYGFEKLYEVQINQFVNIDGLRPFRLAPDKAFVSCSWKKLEHYKKAEVPVPEDI